MIDRTKPALCLVGVLLAACVPGEPPLVPLAPPETFHWTEHPITFSPPPVEWERQREQSGGLLGVRFVYRGASITVAEHSDLASRDRRGVFEELLAAVDHLPADDLALRLQRAQMFTTQPVNRQETEIAEKVNGWLNVPVHREPDRPAIRQAVESSLREARKVRYTLDEVLGRIRVRPEHWDGVGRVEIGPPVDSTTAGRPSKTVEFTLSTPRGNAVAREVYVVSDNHLFVAKCVTSRVEDLALFDRVVASIVLSPDEPL